MKNKALSLLIIIATLSLLVFLSPNPVSAQGPLSISVTPGTVTATNTYVNVAIRITSAVAYSGPVVIDLSAPDIGVVTHLSCAPSASCDGLSLTQNVNLAAGASHNFSAQVRVDAGASYGAKISAGGNYGNADIGYFELNKATFINYNQPAATAVPPTATAVPQPTATPVPTTAPAQVSAAFSYQVQSTVDADGNRTNVISGSGIPNQIINVIIHSRPQTYTTTVNAIGEWQVIINQELEQGEHEIFVQLLNADQLATSDEVKLGGLFMGTNGELAQNEASLSINQPSPTSVGGDAGKDSSIFPILAVMVLGAGAGALGGAAMMWLKKRKLAKTITAEANETKIQ